MNDTLSLCIGPQGEQGCSARAGAQGLLHCVTVRQRRAAVRVQPSDRKHMVK